MREVKLDKRSYSGGMITITDKRFVVAKDEANSSTDILVTNIFIKAGGYLKAINYYAQPQRRVSSFKLLRKVISRIRKAEPGI